MASWTSSIALLVCLLTTHKIETPAGTLHVVQAARRPVAEYCACADTRSRSRCKACVAAVRWRLRGGGCAWSHAVSLSVQAGRCLVVRTECVASCQGVALQRGRHLARQGH